MKPLDRIKIDWKSNYLKVFLIGLAVSFAFFLPYLIMDGGYFLYYGDFNVQQIPFYSLAHDSLRAGAAGWSFNTDLGANFVGSYSFYLLGSPFFWLTIPFPDAAVPFLMAPLLMLKFAFTGVTGYAFIQRFTRTRDMALLGGLLYAFSGFNLYNIFFNHFNEAVMVFPLLLIGMEELLINNRRGGFALAVAVCAVVNYYFFFGQVLFCILYFFVRARSGEYRLCVSRFLTLVLEAVLGVLLAGVLLLPSFWAVIGNPRTGETLTGFDTILYGNVQRYGLILSSFFFPPDIPARPNLFPDSNAKWSSVSMWLPLFSTVGVFAFFKGKRGHWAKPLLLICFAVCFIPMLNAAFSLFNYSYYARWFYMPLLVMALATCVAFEDCPGCFKSGIKWTAGFVFAFALIGIIPKKVNGVLEWFTLPAYPERLWAYVLISAAGLLCTGMLVLLYRRSRFFRRCAIVSVCCITVITATFMIYTGKLASGYDLEENGKRTYYNQVVNEALNGREKLRLDEEEFFRIDTYDELDNLGMFWRLPTINAFQSVVPSSIMEYYELIGGERGVGSRPKPELLGVRGLTSVKYAFIREGKGAIGMPGFSYLDTRNNYKIYQNDHFVPMGFTYDYFITQKELDRCDQNRRDRLLLQGLYLSDEDYERYQDLLPLLPAVEVNGGYGGGDSQDSYDQIYFDACDRLAENRVWDFAIDNEGFSAVSDLEAANLVFFSVPYERGWTATVNGIETEIVKANGGFMAVKAPAGASNIRFTYETPGLKAGAVISLGALLLLAGYLLWVRRQRRLHPDLRYRRYAHRYRLEQHPRIAARDAYAARLTRRARKEKDPEETES